MSQATEGARPDFFQQESVAFLEWFTNSPGTRVSDKIVLADLRSQGAGRGIAAKEDLAEDEELFAVPRSLVLEAQNSDISVQFHDALLGSDPWLPLIVAIIYEYLNQQYSRWSPYLAVLPTKFDSLMFWSDSELAELQGSAVREKIGKKYEEDNWKENIIPFMLSHPDFFSVKGTSEEEKTEELIRLAHIAGSLIMAYAFDIDKADDDDDAEAESEEDSLVEDDGDDEAPLKGMVPFADMLNADADRNNARLFQEDDCLIMRTTKAIKVGQEIFNDYGPLPRSDLLRMYGFITDNYAQYDVVEVSSALIHDIAHGNNFQQVETMSKNIAALDELGLFEAGYAISRPGEFMALHDAVPAELRMLLRACCCQFGKSIDEKSLKRAGKEDVSIEEAALLSGVCAKRLTDFVTNIEQDEKLLADLLSVAFTPLSISKNRYGMAVQVRKGEKEILHSIITLCQKHIEEKTSTTANEAMKRKYQPKEHSSEKKKLKMAR